MKLHAQCLPKSYILYLAIPAFHCSFITSTVWNAQIKDIPAWHSVIFENFGILARTSNYVLGALRLIYLHRVPLWLMVNLPKSAWGWRVYLLEVSDRSVDRYLVRCDRLECGEWGYNHTRCYNECSYQEPAWLLWTQEFPGSPHSPSGRSYCSWSADDCAE